jgi:hypothetical protein
MSFWKSLLIDFSFVALYILFYYILGFELTVILALANIVSDLTKKEYPKKTQIPTKQMYVQSKTKMRF